MTMRSLRRYRTLYLGCGEGLNSRVLLASVRGNRARHMVVRAGRKNPRGSKQ